MVHRLLQFFLALHAKATQWCFISRRSEVRPNGRLILKHVVGVSTDQFAGLWAINLGLELFTVSCFIDF